MTSKAQEIRKAVSKLSRDEIDKFREWFEKFDAGRWDKQFEEDVRAGKLDAVSKRAIPDHKDRKSTQL